jgi:hypothetical protein
MAGKEHFRKSPDKLTFEHVRDTQRQFVYTHPWPSTTCSFGTIAARCTVEPSSTTCAGSATCSALPSATLQILASHKASVSKPRLARKLLSRAQQRTAESPKAKQQSPFGRQSTSQLAWLRALPATLEVGDEVFVAMAVRTTITPTYWKMSREGANIARCDAVFGLYKRDRVGFAGIDLSTASFEDPRM